jgi:hypothetical protein
MIDMSEKAAPDVSWEFAKSNQLYSFGENMRRIYHQITGETICFVAQKNGEWHVFMNQTVSVDLMFYAMLIVRQW